jgi:tetratricopeptide (TPR) repeat protein
MSGSSLAVHDDPGTAGPTSDGLTAGERRSVLAESLAALPALLVGLAAAVVALAISWNGESWLTGRYEAAAKSCLESQNYPAAQLCYERLVRLDGGRPETLFGLALSLLGGGNTRRAEMLLDQIAPPGRPGFAPAQLWRAQWLLRQARQSPEALRAAEPYLQRVLEAQPRSLEGNALTGQLYAATGRWKQAVPPLTLAANDRPELRFLLASAHAALGNREVARAHWDMALRVFSERTEAAPGDVEARLNWARAATLLGEYPQAVGILKQGLAQSDDPRLHRALARAYAAQASAVRDSGEQLALVRLGLEHDPADSGLLQALMAVIQAGEPTAEAGRAALKAVLAGGGSSQTARFLQGLDALQTGKADDLCAAEQHFHRALEDRPEDIEANALLGQLYAAAGLWSRAVPYLARSAEDRPELRFLLASTYQAQGKGEDVRAQWGLVRRYFQERTEAAPGDNEARLGWARATLLLGEYPQAVDVLQQGLVLCDDPRFHRTLARAYAGQADAVARHPGSSPGERLALIELGLPHDPAAPGLLPGLMAVIQAGGPTAERGRAVLKALLADGRAPEMVHYFLGLDAWQSGKVEQARLYWEEAHRLAPQMPEVANNLAWLLANAPAPDLTPDLPRALKLADLAVAAQPDQPSYRDTRGRILVQLRRWEEALPRRG